MLLLSYVSLFGFYICVCHLVLVAVTGLLVSRLKLTIIIPCVFLCVCAPYCYVASCILYPQGTYCDLSVSWLHFLYFCIFYGRYAEILEDFKKDPESHGGPPDGIVSQSLKESSKELLSPSSSINFSWNMWFLILSFIHFRMEILIFLVTLFFWGDMLASLQNSWANP